MIKQWNFGINSNNSGERLRSFRVSLEMLPPTAVRRVHTIESARYLVSICKPIQESNIERSQRQAEAYINKQYGLTNNSHEAAVTTETAYDPSPAVSTSAPLESDPPQPARSKINQPELAEDAYLKLSKARLEGQSNA